MNANIIKNAANNMALMSVFAGVLALFGAVNIAIADTAAIPQAVPVGVDLVKQEPLSQTMPVIGRLVATKSGVIAARTTGPVAEFIVQVGDRVQKDDVIAVLVKDALESRRELWVSQVKQASAAVGTRQAELQLREQELKRLKKLKSSAAFSQAKLDDKLQEVVMIKSVIAEGKASLGVAKANRMLADINLYNADVRASYDGIVTQRHTEVGAFIKVGDPLVTLIDDTTLEIAADVPTERIAGLIAGTPIPFTMSESMSGIAVVRAVIPDENPLTRTRSVRFTAPLDSSTPLAANQSIVLSIPVGAPRNVVSVHKDAVLNRGGKTMVYVVQDGIADIKPVILGEALGERFEILSGLSIGDIIVVRGNERLRPGQAVSYPTIDDQVQG